VGNGEPGNSMMHTRWAGLRAKLASCGVALALVSGTAAGQELSESPRELVLHTIQNEIKSSESGPKVMFKDYKETAHGSQTKLIVETSEGTAGMLIAVNGKPLTAEQRRQEEAHLDGLVNRPVELKKKQRSEREDADRTIRIMKALPDAFLSVRGEVGEDGKSFPAGELVRLDFRPNPKYDPPSHVEQVLTGMRGYIVIDAKQHRIVRIEGKLFKDVSFGWGILGHLDKGGVFIVQQAPVGNMDWEVTRMDLAFTGRELLFKKLLIKSDEVFSDYRPVPQDLTFAQAVELLKKSVSELAENRQ